MLSHALTLDSRNVALELHALLREIDPSRWRDDIEASVRERFAAFEKRVQALLNAIRNDDRWAAVGEWLNEIARLLREGAPSAGLPMQELRKEWKAFRIRLQASYNGLAASLSRFDIHVPNLRPTNYARNVFHASAAVVALLTVHYILSPSLTIALAGAFALYAWSMEAGRRLSKGLNDRLMGFYGRIAHPHEWNRVNSGTWFITALLMLSLTASPLLCTVALAVLGFADPAAGLIGRRWGRIRLINGRSLEGVLSFITVGTMAGLASLALWYPQVPWSAKLALALGAALPGSLAELLARRIDDNLVIPAASAIGIWLVASSLGLPL